MGRAWAELMTSLGYRRCVAQGAFVVDQMGLQAPAGLLGIHTNMPATVLAQTEQRKARPLTMPVLAIGGAESWGELVGDGIKPAADDVQSLVIPGTSHWGLHTASARLPVEGELPSLGGATGWLNSAPLTVAGLSGNVVLVNFWTYTCINWLRQLPYLRAWADKYSRHGLVVVGVHTPEFAFERKVENVSRAVREMRIEYPVALDNDYAVWSVFDNHYWPALYFADAEGLIRHHHFGEGEYQQSEMVLQQLLAEAGSADPGHEPIPLS
jgi:thiol-disulfide isomerase/thioredoxin